MLNYTIVFTISEEPMPTGPLLGGLVIGASLIAISIGLFITRRSSEFARKARFYSAGFGIGIFFIVGVLSQMKENFDGMAEAIRAGHVRVVEGKVENFHPMPKSGHDAERFTVQGRSFAYSDYSVTGGFNNTSSHGGPIKNELPVRITYIDGNVGRVIVKLEVGNDYNSALHVDAQALP